MIARIRPLLNNERDADVIVESGGTPVADATGIVRIPNPKNAAESFSFNFSRVFDQHASQQALYESEGI